MTMPKPMRSMKMVMKMITKGDRLFAINPCVPFALRRRPDPRHYSEDAQHAAQQLALERRVTLITHDGAHQHAAHAAMMLRQQDHRIREEAPAKSPAIKQRQAMCSALKIMAEGRAPVRFIGRRRFLVAIRG